MKRTGIDYFEALTLLLSTHFQVRNIINKNELSASLTHWLQNQKSQPILLPENSKNEFNDILTKFSSLSIGELSIDNFIENRVPKVNLRYPTKSSSFGKYLFLMAQFYSKRTELTS